MTYNEKIQNCSTLDELFEIWRSKPESKQRIVFGGQTELLTIDYRKDGFISDGIVDKLSWHKKRPKILFVMKSLDYIRDNFDNDVRRSMFLKEILGDRMWTLGIWAKGLLLTNENQIYPFIHTSFTDKANWWTEMAVLFLNKTRTGKIATPDIIDLYAKNDRIEIKKEIEIIDPDVVVCCSTFRTLLSVMYGKRVISYSNPRNDEPVIQSENDWCYSLPINGRDRLFIDYFEPGWPDLIAYYGLVAIYQQALINGRIHLGGTEC